MIPTQQENEITQPTELRDFFEWHQGIKYYGFWAIEVQNPRCLQQLNIWQQSIADTLHPNYLRQAHITLSASGLLDEKHFTEHDLQQQIEALKRARIPAFSICSSSPNTFTTAPYLSINDPSISLARIRDQLHHLRDGQDACEYIPHITLGFYNQAYSIPQILNQLSSLNIPAIEFKVKELVFARYNTHEIQGRYHVLHRIPLDWIIDFLLDAQRQ